MTRDTRKPLAPGDLVSESPGPLLSVTIGCAGCEEWRAACASKGGLWFETQSGTCDRDGVSLLEELLP